MSVFVSDLELSRRFFPETVRPLLTDAFPDLRYAAALLGPGSEVLGFDTEMPVDHNWGPLCWLREVSAENREGFISSITSSTSSCEYLSCEESVVIRIGFTWLP